MKSTALTSLRGLGARLSALMLASILMSAAITPRAHATDFAETAPGSGSPGDLSNLGSTPTFIPFAVGSNRISGFTGAQPTPADIDRDYFTFTLGANEILSGITVLPGTVALGRTLIAISTGSQMTVSPTGGSAVGLLGWTLFSGSDVGADILDDLGAASPPSFPPFPGATRFAPPLGPGSYTVWIQDNAQGQATYALDFNVASVPEPSTWAMMLVGFGAIGFAMRRQNRCKAVRYNFS